MRGKPLQPGFDDTHAAAMVIEALDFALVDIRLVRLPGLGAARSGPFFLAGLRDAPGLRLSAKSAPNTAPALGAPVGATATQGPPARSDLWSSREARRAGYCDGTASHQWKKVGSLAVPRDARYASMSLSSWSVTRAEKLGIPVGVPSWTTSTSTSRPRRFGHMPPPANCPWQL